MLPWTQGRVPFEFLFLRINTQKWSCWIIWYFYFFSFLRKFRLVSHLGCTNLNSYQHCWRLPSLHVRSITCFFLPFDMAQRTGGRWYLTVVSIFIPLIHCDVEHLFMGLLGICRSFLAKNAYAPAPFFFFILWPHPWYVEVPRLGVESELQLPAFTTATAVSDPSHIGDLHCNLRQFGILNPRNEARDWIRILPDTMLGS